MCGIAGIWNFDNKPVSQASIERFTDSLAHRGPDGRGFWRDDSLGIALGHRRLSILDLSENASQPMSYLEERYWITYNGEIYNFLELRKELEAKGYKFRTQSDTEIILAAYHEWGPDMQLKFNGMWAFAIFDRQERRLFISRDRFGIKPFHYNYTANGFSFASELKAFKFLDDFKAEVDKETALVYLENSFGIEGTMRSMLKGVNRLLGGHCGILENGKLTISRWWNTLDHLNDTPDTLVKQAEKFYELFYDSVKMRMRSDVPIGTCLSGGFDSSSIVCTMAEIGKHNKGERQSDDWQRAFIATFPGAVNDESEEAKKVVEYANVKGNFFPVTDKESIHDIDKILYDFDSVYISMPTAVWLIYRELKNNNTVVSLDGHGADELMGMYAQADYVTFHDAPSFLFSLGENKKLIKEYRDFLASMPNPQLFKKPVSAIYHNHPDFKFIRNTKDFIFKTGSIVKRFLYPENSFFLWESARHNTDFIQLGSNDKVPKNWGAINRSLYKQFHSNILPTILRNFDRTSMAHGVESRMPFLDWRLVSYVFSLPDSSKVGYGLTKLVARKAMKGKMPESIRTAKLKIGFSSPMPEWLNGPLQGWVNNLIYDKEIKHHDLINMKKFSNFVEENSLSRSWNWGNCESAWRVLNYLWFEKRFLSPELK